MEIKERRTLPPRESESEKKNREDRGKGGRGERDPRGVKGVHEGTRHREAYMRRRGSGGGEGEGTGRGSVAPRSHAFRSVMAAASRSDTLRPSSSCAHAHTAARRRAPAGRPAGLVALAERGEKERPRKTERKRRALSSVRARCLLGIRGHGYPRNTGGPAIIRATRLVVPARASRRANARATFPIYRVHVIIGRFSVNCCTDSVSSSQLFFIFFI